MAHQLQKNLKVRARAENSQGGRKFARLGTATTFHRPEASILLLTLTRFYRFRVELLPSRRNSILEVHASEGRARETPLSNGQSHPMKLEALKLALDTHSVTNIVCWRTRTNQNHLGVELGITNVVVAEVYR